MLKQPSEPVIDSTKDSLFFPASVSDYTEAQFHTFDNLDRKKNCDSFISLTGEITLRCGGMEGEVLILKHCFLGCGRISYILNDFVWSLVFFVKT